MGNINNFSFFTSKNYVTKKILVIFKLDKLSAFSLYLFKLLLYYKLYLIYHLFLK